MTSIRCSILVCTLIAMLACTRAQPQSESTGASFAEQTTAARQKNGDADAARGKQLFAENCSGCHGAAGEGSAGPPLQGERAHKNLAQVAAFVKDPQPPMPKLYPTPLSDAAVRDVAAYVESL